MQPHRVIRAALPVIALPLLLTAVGTKGGQAPAQPQAQMINASGWHQPRDVDPHSGSD